MTTMTVMTTAPLATHHPTMAVMHHRWLAARVDDTVSANPSAISL
jgi:hypothetical protein